MIECLPEAGFGRSIDLRYTETVGQRGRQRVTEGNRQKGLARLFSKRIRRGKAPSRNFLPSPLIKERGIRSEGLVKNLKLV